MSMSVQKNISVQEKPNV